MFKRYERQLQLPNFGITTQTKLQEAKVLVVGAGALGAAILPVLAGAGIGNIGIIDADTVSVTNLHRQFIYTEKQAGESKAVLAKQFLEALNSQIQIAAYPVMLEAENAASFIQLYDLIIDATDNLATKLLINDTCETLHKPWIYGAVSQFEGQWAFFNLPTDNGDRTANYRHLFPSIKATDAATNCNDNGVIGVLPTIIGHFMAAEAIKFCSGWLQAVGNQLFVYRLSTHQINSFQIKRMETLMNENAINAAVNENNLLYSDIDAATFLALIEKNDCLIVDVRNLHELPRFNHPNCVSIPMANLPEQLSVAANFTNIVAICSAGLRSETAAELLVEQFGTEKQIFNLKGGLYKWNESLKTYL
ncbi:MAG: ThiF family adenylyltransferase [Chitinophagaceae bacterium]